MNEWLFIHQVIIFFQLVLYVFTIVLHIQLGLLGEILINESMVIKRLNHKWPFLNILTFSQKRFFERCFWQHVLKNIEFFPNKLHYLC